MRWLRQLHRWVTNADLKELREKSDREYEEIKKRCEEEDKYWETMEIERIVSPCCKEDIRTKRVFNKRVFWIEDYCQGCWKKVESFHLIYRRSND